MNGSTLVLITNHYPFGQGESFLEHEMPYLATAFSKVLVISKNTTAVQTHHLPSNVTVERIAHASSFFQNIRTAWYCFRNRKEFKKLLKEELQYAKDRNKTGVSRTAFHFLFKAFELSKTFSRIVEKHGYPGKICFYSYWVNNSALAITLLKNHSQSIKVCRAHGGDLYENRQPNNYLPFRNILVKNLTRIYPVSNHGEKYLKSLFTNSLNATIERSYLGTREPLNIPPFKESKRFTIVSCSSLIELKRVHLIIESLALVTEPVLWLHFGDGPLKHELSLLANNKLNERQNIEYLFKGFVSNADLIDFYSHTTVNLFINTSQYEGLPVSMMEAQSFGIPILGTNVGAVNEIVTSQTGWLLPEHASPAEITEVIRHLFSQSPEAVAALRKACRTHWESNFKAADNFSTFATNLNLLLNESSD